MHSVGYNKYIYHIARTYNETSHLLPQQVEIYVLQDCLISIRQVPIRPQVYEVTTDVCVRNARQLKKGAKSSQFQSV